MLGSFESDLMAARALHNTPVSLPLEVNLGTLSYDEIGMAYIGMINLLEDPAERDRLVDEFRENCPGLFQFLNMLDQKEKEALEAEGAAEELAEIDGIMHPKIATMLLSFSIVRAATDVVNMKSRYGDI